MTSHDPSPSRVAALYLATLGFRWTPLGIILPVFVLLMQDRGLGLAEVGIALAVQSAVAMAAEIPSGRLADRYGQRLTLLLGSLLRAGSLITLLLAGSLTIFCLAWALEGASRALDSGSLDSWAVNAHDLDQRSSAVPPLLARGGTVIGLSIAVGGLITSIAAAIPALRESAKSMFGTPLGASVAAALVVQAGHVLVVALFIHERPGARPHRRDRAAAEVPRPAANFWPVLLGSRPLLLLVAAEAVWSLGMAGVEVLWQPNVSAALPSDTGATVLGIISAGVWVLSAVGAAAVGPARRILPDLRHLATGLRVLQAAAVLAFSLVSPLGALVAAYALIYAVHGASNPVHQALLHQDLADDQRTTGVSVNSFAAQAASLIGTLALPATAASYGIGPALAAASLVVAASGPIYLAVRSARTDLSISSLTRT